MQIAKQIQVLSFFIAFVCVFLHSNVAFSQVVDFQSFFQSIKDTFTQIKESKTVVDTMDKAKKMAAAIGTAKKTVSEMKVVYETKVKANVEKAQKYMEKAKEYKAEYEKYKAELDASIEKAKGLKDKAEGAIDKAEGAIDKAKDVVGKETNTSDKTTNQLNTKTSNTANAPSKSAKTDDGLKVQQATKQKTSSVSKNKSDTVTLTEDRSVTPSRQAFEIPETTQTAVSAVSAVSKGGESISVDKYEGQKLNKEHDKAEIMNEKRLENAFDGKKSVIGNVEPNQLIKNDKAETSKIKGKSSENLDGSNSDTTKQNNLKNKAQDSKSSNKDTKNIETTSIPKKNDDVKQELIRTPARKSFTTSNLSRKESFAFAKIEALSDGGTDANGTFLISREAAMFCGVGSADIQKEGVADECFLRLNKERNSAQDGNVYGAPTVYNKTIAQYAASTIAEAFKALNDAETFEEKVIEPIDFASEPTAQDVYSNIVEMNKAVNAQMNGLLKIYSSQLLLKSVKNYGDYMFLPPEEENSNDS